MTDQQKPSADQQDHPDYPLTNVENFHPHDVLCGRGGGTNNHVGNENWRNLIAANKRLYISLPKRQKMLVAQSIVKAVRAQNPPGRFLQKDQKTGLYSDIGDQKAHDKTSQALREGAPEIREVMRSEKKLGVHVSPGGNAAFNTMTNYMAMNMMNSGVGVGAPPQSLSAGTMMAPPQVVTSYTASTNGTGTTGSTSSGANSEAKPFQLPGSMSPAQIPSLPPMPMMAPSSPNVNAYPQNITTMHLQQQGQAQQPQQQQQRGPVPGGVGSSSDPFPVHQPQQSIPTSYHQQLQISQQQQQRGPVSQQPLQSAGPAPSPVPLPTAVGASNDAELAKMFVPPSPSNIGNGVHGHRVTEGRGGEDSSVGNRSGAAPSSQPPPATGNIAAQPTANDGGADHLAQGDGQQPKADGPTSNGVVDPPFVGDGQAAASVAPTPGDVDGATDVDHRAMAPPAPRSPRKAHFAAPPPQGNEHEDVSDLPAPLPTDLETGESMTLKDFLSNASFRSTDPNKKSLIDMSDDEDSQEDLDQRAASRNAQIEKLKDSLINGTHNEPQLGRDPSIALTEFMDDMSIGMPLSRGVSRASEALGAYAGDLVLSGDIDMTSLDRDLSLALSDMSLSRGVSGVSMGGFGAPKDDSGLTMARVRERIEMEYLNRGPSLAFEWSGGGANASVGRPSATAMNHAFGSDIHGGFAINDEKEGTTG